MQENNDRWKFVQKILDQNFKIDRLGRYYSNTISTDIKHLGFTLARYKFVAKLLSRTSGLTVLELGCQEAFGELMLEQNTDLHKYTGVDMDDIAISWNKQNIKNENAHFICSDFFALPKKTEKYDAVICLDVIEHIRPETEDEFIRLMADNLNECGTAIVGTPNIMMSPYASETSKVAHINLYDQDRLYKEMNKYFHNVFIFNMNDEMVNVSFDKMSCYIFAVCCNKKKS